jgi:hypothetical protein
VKGGDKGMNPKIIEVSFGYDMTINHYFLILNENEKTALVQRVGTKVDNDDGMGGGHSVPNLEIRIDEPFRVYKRDQYYASKFGLSTIHHADLWDGKPSYYNTWD